ncbi:MAG: hypothetical protein KUG77_08690 [Nannocystaceae bacterium]|nr:hypothetical protein [Nannocystaceae bacterium]
MMILRRSAHRLLFTGSFFLVATGCNSAVEVSDTDGAEGSGTENGPNSTGADSTADDYTGDDSLSLIHI